MGSRSGGAVATIILCGGRGTRAYPHTMEVPKPMMEVAGRPIVRHVMEIYAGQGFTRFVLAAGFKYESLREYAKDLPSDWKVEVIDTGEDTDKADRIQACRDRVDDIFLATYSDGVGNVRLNDLLDFHSAHGGAATITTVPLPSQYGTVDTSEDGQVNTFVERPRLTDHWINAGFFVFEQEAFEHWTGPDLERDVFPALGNAGLLYAYRHDGFWRSMDTYKESLELDEIARASERAREEPPWLTSGRVAYS